MRHARNDYNRIQDPAGKIGMDEPVFLLRGKDEWAPMTIKYWASLVRGKDPELADSIDKYADDMMTWQQENGCKRPDTPEEFLYK